MKHSEMRIKDLREERLRTVETLIGELQPIVTGTQARIDDLALEADRLRRQLAAEPS